jgi:hypothetical protein
MVSFTPWPLYLRGKPPVPIDKEAGWAPKPLPVPELELRPVASRYPAVFTYLKIRVNSVQVAPGKASKVHGAKLFL